MKGVKFVFGMMLVFLNLSFATPYQAGQRIGIITDGYGIVTDADLDEEEARCNNIEAFPSDNLCFNFWQCLPTRTMFVGCEDIGDTSDFEHTGSAVFWIQDGENIHNYLTRRNFSVESCHQWLQAWKEVLENEDVVCISGNFIGKADEGYDLNSPVGTHYSWIIDRMKSRHGEWSYFYRGHEIEAEEAN